MFTLTPCRIPWIRDEVLLALSVVLHGHKNTYPVDSQECQELSRQLKALPIIPLDKRSANFRNATGMKIQLEKLDNLLYKGKISGHSNNLFATVINDFTNYEELFLVASAIRNNIDFAKEIPAVYFQRPSVFKEGILLEGIHCYFEDKSTADLEDHCEICGMFPETIYAAGISFSSILERHCLTSPEALSKKTPLNKRNMLTVCPTCHKVLHEYRPWITTSNLSTVLQWK